MPGLKRRAAAVVQEEGQGGGVGRQDKRIATTVSKGRGKAKQTGSSRVTFTSAATEDSDDEGDDQQEDDDEQEDYDQFDDGEDLMARAMAGGMDDDEDEDSEEAEYDADEPATVDAEYEDSEGGFEDLEAAEERSDPEDGHSVAESTAGPSKRPSKPAALYALPTNDEVSALRSTSELFKNNVLKLQIDELCSELRPPSQQSSKVKPLETLLRRLHGLLTSIESLSARPLGEARTLLRKRFKGSSRTQSIPFCDPQPAEHSPLPFAFEKPTGMHIVGSWALRTASRRPDGIDVDVAVVMPASIFQEKDHLNFRYFHKRAFYLAVLAAAIEKESAALGVTLNYECPDGDPRRPVIVLRPIKGQSAEMDFSKLKAVIRIRPAYDGDLFAPARLAPNRNSVRLGATSSDLHNVEEQEQQSPTPRYNTAVLLDGLYLPHLVYLHESAKPCAAFADACLLLHSWAFQRGFGSGKKSVSKKTANGTADSEERGIVTGFWHARYFLTMLLAHLLNGDDHAAKSAKGPSSTTSITAARAKLAPSFSSYQLFRGVIDWLATHDFDRTPVFMRALGDAMGGTSSRASKIPRESFSEHFERVFVDPTGSVNLLTATPSGSVDLLQSEARRTLALLTDSEADHFPELFLRDLSVPAAGAGRFDEVVVVEVEDLELSIEDDNAATVAAGAVVDFGSHDAALVDALQRTLTKGLSSRALVVALFTSASDPGQSRLQIGLRYDPVSAFRMVDHGPAPDDPVAVQAFKDFWGDLSELRRFKDGRIVESVVWMTQGAFSRPNIPRKIVRHVLSRHHGLSKDGGRAVFLGQAFDGLLEPDRVLSDLAYLSSPAERGYQLVRTAFDDLSRQLKELNGMPLALVTVAPASSGLRAMSTFVPAALNLSRLGDRSPDAASFLPAHEIVLTFESSGRWPDELVAIQATKAALLERVAGVLMGQDASIHASIGFDAAARESNDLLDAVWLDIVLPVGFAFRARIHHDRERTLLERIIVDKKGESSSRRVKATEAFEAHVRRFTSATRHHDDMVTLQSVFAGAGHAGSLAGGLGGGGALSETIRMTKRWLSAQMLSGQVAEEAVELLCVSVFANAALSAEGLLRGPSAESLSSPSTGPAGFLLVLHHLASWRWREEPLFAPVMSITRASDDRSMRLDAGGDFSKAAALSTRFPSAKRLVVTEAFAQARRSDPGISHRAWFIATELDVEGRNWTEHSPSAGVADGIARLARAAVQRMKGTSWTPNSDGIRSLFRPALAHYDVLIQLKPATCNRLIEAIEGATSQLVDLSDSAASRYRNAEEAAVLSALSALPHPICVADAAASLLRPGFDSASAFVSLLRSLYADTLRAFHNENGSTSIGLSFNPTLSASARSFKVNAGFSSVPVAVAAPTAAAIPDGSTKGSDKVILNSDAIVAEIQRIGGGFVDSVSQTRRD